MQEKIKLGLSLLLFSSILLSMLVVLLGGIFYLSQQGQELVSYQHFSPSSASAISFPDLFKAILAWQPLALIELGILILVFAQILRVLVLGFSFLRSAEYWLALSSFFIFIVITYSMLWRE